MKGNAKVGFRFDAMVRRRSGLIVPAKASGLWMARCWDINGLLKWEDEWKNVVTNEGLTYLMNLGLCNNDTQETAWYIFPFTTAGTPTPAKTWTYATPVATEFTSYSETTRPQWVEANATGSSPVYATNAASPASYSITGSGTLQGAMLVSNNTKGDTTGGGILYAAGNFSGGNKSVASSDTLEITAQMQLDDDGA